MCISWLPLWWLLLLLLLLTACAAWREQEVSGRETALRATLSDKEAELAQLQRTNQAQNEQLAAQQAEIERLQKHVLGMSHSEPSPHLGFPSGRMSPAGAGGFRPHASASHLACVVCVVCVCSAHRVVCSVRCLVWCF